jgi:serine protease Do
LGSGTALDATVSAFDPVSGLALLKIAGERLPVLTLRDAAFPRIGTSGTALFTGSGQGCSVEGGLIGRDFIAAAPANGAFFEAALAADIGLGTPFVGTDGEVLGLAAVTKGDAVSGQTRFIPANMAARLISEMLRTGKAPNAPFGMMTTGLDPVLAKRLQANRQRGAMVMFVRPGSSAGKAGIRPGDLIVAADGKPVAGASEFGRAIDPNAATIEIELTRAGTNRTVRLK